MASRGLKIWVSPTSFQKSNTGWPQEPPTERVSDISKKSNFWWSIPQQARLWACGHGNVSTPSFGSHLNPILTRGGGRLCPPYMYWCPHQVLKATGAPVNSVKMYKAIVTERRYNLRPLKRQKDPHHFWTKFGHSDHSEQQRCGPSLASRTTLSFRRCCPKYASLRVNLLDVDVGKLFHFRFSSFKARTNRKSGTNRKLLDAAACRLAAPRSSSVGWWWRRFGPTTSRFCPWRKKKVPIKYVMEAFSHCYFRIFYHKRISTF